MWGEKFQKVQYNPPKIKHKRVISVNHKEEVLVKNAESNENNKI